MKSPTAALNEVLLQAAIRAERINSDRCSDKHAHDLAKRNDRLASIHRVPEIQTENANGSGNRPQQRA